MKRLLLLSLCIAISCNLVACKASPTANADINAQTVTTALASKQAILIDVRSAGEYNSGHVSTAILAPHDTIAQTIAQIAPDKNQTIYLYCRSGHRAGIALDTLKGMGYTHVSSLGGLNDLAQYGLTLGQ